MIDHTVTYIAQAVSNCHKNYIFFILCIANYISLSCSYMCMYKNVSALEIKKKKKKCYTRMFVELRFQFSVVSIKTLVHYTTPNNFH